MSTPIFNDIKTTLYLALPLVASFLAQKGMQFVDTVMMGWLGPYALAAGALGTTIFVTTLLFCMGTLSVIGVFTAHAFGTQQSSEIKSTLQQGYYLAILGSVAKTSNRQLNQQVHFA